MTAKSASNDKQAIVQLAKQGGALVVGVADPEKFEGAPEGHRPTDLLPRAKSVIVVGDMTDQVRVDGGKLAHHVDQLIYLCRQL